MIYCVKVLIDHQCLMVKYKVQVHVIVRRLKIKLTDLLIKIDTSYLLSLKVGIPLRFMLMVFSTSLPEDVQYNALKSVVGFENVKFFRPGYAIEYDYFPPTQLKHTLETKLVEGLFFAGQINGTTGYEEAASQGLMAGINAALKVQEKEAFVLKRNEAYIGVLIDDLITKGTEEPYRMFTSRAEYRTLLRQDNADFRLTPKGFELGLANEQRLRRMEEKQQKSDAFIRFFRETSVKTRRSESCFRI